LEPQGKHGMVLVRSRESSTTQIDSENSLSPLGYFTEHLVGVFEKLPPENNLDHETSSLSIRWLNSAPVIQSCNKPQPDACPAPEGKPTPDESERDNQALDSVAACSRAVETEARRVTDSWQETRKSGRELDSGARSLVARGRTGRHPWEAFFPSWPNLREAPAAHTEPGRRRHEEPRHTGVKNGTNGGAPQKSKPAAAQGEEARHMAAWLRDKIETGNPSAADLAWRRTKNSAVGSWEEPQCTETKTGKLWCGFGTEPCGGGDPRRKRNEGRATTPGPRRRTCG
jgi:hypothetical protein